MLVRTQFKTGPALFTLAVDQMPHVQLRFAIFRCELDMLFLALILHPQLIVRRCAPHVPRMILAGNMVRML
ncbi:Uncharacterised protein [Klebsiella pneumoniae]|nr:Uncharacterised protein [Klebsiella pneumoniae]SYC34785.1 Uncharacterised protein [Klebsiella pneumoniae]VGB00783.1 Uncharacterised protein [Klebsiella pneumoniae]